LFRENVNLLFRAIEEFYFAQIAKPAIIDVEKLSLALNRS